MDKSDTIAIIRSLLSSTKSSYSVYGLNADFKNETGFDIPLFGFHSVSDFLHSIPETVKVTGIYPIQKVTLVSNEKSAHIVSLVKRQKNSDHRKKPFSRSRSSRKFAINMRVVGVQKSPKLFSKKPASDDGKQKNNDLESEALPLKLNLLAAHKNLKLSSNSTERFGSLQNYLGTGETILHIDLKHYARVGRYVEVWPCQIFGPHKFFFQFRKFKKKFSVLMEKLQIFYNEHREEIPPITHEVMRPKQICAVFFTVSGKPKWHRAEILKIVNKFRVIVNLIDLGYVLEISKETLKYLHRDFTSVPRLAYMGSLANIRPSKGESDWSPSAIKRFFELSFQKDLVGGVVNINFEALCMNLALSCTKGLEVHINDTLVKEGHAEFDMVILHRNFTETNWRKPASQKTDIEIFSKSEQLKEKTNYTVGLTLEPVENKTLKSQLPVMYCSSKHTRNKRLQKMFSFMEEK